MSGHTTLLKKWVNAKQISIKPTDISGSFIRCRIFATIEVAGQDLTYDMFPYNDDFVISVGGSLNLMETKDALKMKVQIELGQVTKPKKQ